MIKAVTVAAALIATAAPAAEVWMLYESNDPNAWTTRLVEEDSGLMLCSTGIRTDPASTAIFLVASEDDFFATVAFPPAHSFKEGSNAIYSWIDGNDFWTIGAKHEGGGVFTIPLGKPAVRYLSEYREGKYVYVDIDGDGLADVVGSLKNFQSAYLAFAECVAGLGGELPTQVGSELAGEKL